MPIQSHFEEKGDVITPIPWAWWPRRRGHRLAWYPHAYRMWIGLARCHIWFKPWEGCYVDEIWTFDPLAGALVNVFNRDGERFMIKPVCAAAGDAPRHIAAMETEVLHAYLPLLEHCAMTRYANGEARSPGWFTVKTIGPYWELTLKDPSTALSCRLRAEKLDDVLVLACAHLAAGDAPWAPDQFLEDARPKRRKRG